MIDVPTDDSVYVAARSKPIIIDVEAKVDKKVGIDWIATHHTTAHYRTTTERQCDHVL